MAGDHLSARQRNGQWWAQHNLTYPWSSTGLHADTTGPGYGSDIERISRLNINLPRYGQTGMPLVDKRVRLQTLGGTPDKTKGVIIECVYSTDVTGFNFFGGTWGRDIACTKGWYNFGLYLQMQPINDSINDTQGRAVAYVGDIGGAWPYTSVYEKKVAINDGQPHHIAAVWPAGSTLVSLYVDGELVQQRRYQNTMADLAPDEVWASADAFFTHCDGIVSHLAVGAAPPFGIDAGDPGAEIVARAHFTPSMVRGKAHLRAGHKGSLPDAGVVMGWDNDNKQWCPVKGWDGSTWKEVKV